MIQMPRRSVTRFFIPLIDVMILLFCIFLLLPTFKENDPENPDVIARKKLKITEEELKKLREEIAELRKFYRSSGVRVLEISPQTGILFYYEKGTPPRKVELRTASDAAALIKKEEADLGGKLKVHYVLLYPLPEAKSVRPSQEQVLQYEKWFRGSPLTLDRRGN